MTSVPYCTKNKLSIHILHKKKAKKIHLDRPVSKRCEHHFSDQFLSGRFCLDNLLSYFLKAKYVTFQHNYNMNMMWYGVHFLRDSMPCLIGFTVKDFARSLRTLAGRLSLNYFKLLEPGIQIPYFSYLQSHMEYNTKFEYEVRIWTSNTNFEWECEYDYEYWLRIIIHNNIGVSVIIHKIWSWD